jgi:hypothetical protein
MPSDLPTAKISPAPVVLVVGCAPALVKRVRDAAIMGQALVIEAEVERAATMAAQTRPLVLVMPDEVYRADAAGFSALALDVRARLVALGDDAVPQRELEEMIVGAIVDADAHRESLASS